MAEEIRDIPGRFIDDVPYSGLIERLSQIVLMSEVVSATGHDLDKPDILGIVDQIAKCAEEALIFTCVEPADLKYVSSYVLAGATIARD